MAYIFIILLAIGYFSLRNRIARLEEQLSSRTVTKKEPDTQQVITPTPVAVPLAIEIPEEAPVNVESEYQAPLVVKEKKDGDSLEFKFGSKIFTAIGAIAVIIGLGFFLQYAFQTGLITETMRVVLGVVVGIIISGIGYWAQKKYASYGQVLIGTGLGILYLSIYSAYNFYHLITHPLALFWMLVVTIVGVIASLRLNALPLAAFAGIGGFLTPALLGTIGGNPHLLFTYIIILDLGFLAISFHKLWRPLAFGSFIATALIFISWLSQAYTGDQWLLAEIYLSIFFFIFLFVSLFHYWRGIAMEDEYDLALMVGNALIYFIISYGIINTPYHEWMGLFTIILGAIYCGIWLFVRAENPRDIRFRTFLAGISFIMFVIAVPIQFEKFAITIAWAAEALALTYTAVKIKSRSLKIFSQGIFAVVFIKLMMIDSMIAVDTPWINLRFITFAISLLCFVGAFLCYYFQPSKTDDDETILGVGMFEMSLVFLVGISSDLYKFFDASYLSFFWFIAVALIALAAFYTRNIVGRFIMFVLLIVSVLRIFLVYSSLASNNIAFFNMRASLFFFAIIISAFLYFLYTRSTDQKIMGERPSATTFLAVDIFILLQALVSFEIRDFFPQYWYGVAWSLIALLAVYVSFSMKSKTLRVCAYITFLIATLRVLFFDSTVPLSDYAPIFNGRVLAFIVVGVSLLLVSYILHKKSGELTVGEQGTIMPVFAIVANILFIWLLSSEVLDFFNRQVIASSSASDISTLESVKRVALSIAWLLYSFVLMGIGIAKRFKNGRVLAIILIIVTIFKVFLYDTAELDNFYRFISYISLGVLLLVTGFVYNKFKTIIIQLMRE